MLTNKAHWVTDGENVRLSMPIGKIDVERRMVSGFATLDNLDRQGDIVTTESSIEAFKNFRGNLREMHQPSAIGKYFDPNDKKFYSGVYVSAYVSKGAQDAWEKVLDGTYTGFSIGGNIKSWDDAYDEKIDKTVRVIKTYELHELSLVDNPANQFANIVSIEKINGQNVVGGYLSKAEIENVFWDSDSGIVITSEEDSAVSPVNGNKMQNIGFIEKSDKENTEMIKFLVDSAKGINPIKINKEVNLMTESTETAQEAVVENAEVAPEAQPTEVAAEAVVEAPAQAAETTVVAEEAPAAEELAVAKSDNASADSAVVETSTELHKAEDAVADAVANVKEEVAKAVSDINASLTNAFGDLAETIKSLNEKVTAVTKTLDSVTNDVNGLKNNFNEFGKRVDLVEQDTAFRKSGDLGEIVQESPQVIQKSLWGGRFLTNADLFN
jgi:hypothetical protein